MFICLYIYIQTHHQPRSKLTFPNPGKSVTLSVGTSLLPTVGPREYVRIGYSRKSAVWTGPGLTAQFLDAREIRYLIRRNPPVAYRRTYGFYPVRYLN